jgi:ribosomal protein S18 acetylase RimI-like enzyme
LRARTPIHVEAPRPELTIDVVDPLPLAAELREVHRAALGAGALSEEWAATRLPAHALREDFVFLVAREGEEVAPSAIAGFAYGYTGSSGQWWTDRVERSLTAAQRAEWIESPHYEIVELHVRPSQQRRGIGSALLAQLLTRQPHDRALLSTQTGSRKARSFYAKNGWSELASVDFGPGYPPYIVLGKRLLPGA